MSSSPLLKVKIPYVDKKTDITEAFNYLVKTVNSSFIETPDVVEEAPSDIITLSGVYFSGSFSGTGPGGIFNATFNHNFSTIPSGFLVVDSISTEMNNGGSLCITRRSWTTTQISVRITLDTGSFLAYSGTYRILVLR